MTDDIAQKHAKIMSVFKSMQVEHLYNYADPDYTWYIPKRRTNSPFVYLCKAVDFNAGVSLGQNIIAVHLPNTVSEFVLYSPGYNVNIHINENEPDLDTILEQTRTVPNALNVSNTIDGYVRYLLPTPYMRYFTIQVQDPCIAYFEVLMNYTSTYSLIIYSNVTNKYYTYDNNCIIIAKNTDFYTKCDISKYCVDNSHAIMTLIMQNAKIQK